jgi:hypothetical protein
MNQPAAAGFAGEAVPMQRWLRRIALMVGAGVTGVIMATALMSLLAKPAGADQVSAQAPITIQGPIPVTVPVSVPVSMPVPVVVTSPIAVASPTPPSLRPAALVDAVTQATGPLATTASSSLGSLPSTTASTLAPVLAPVVSGATRTVAPIAGLPGAATSLGSRTGGTTGPGSSVGSLLDGDAFPGFATLSPSPVPTDGSGSAQGPVSPARLPGPTPSLPFAPSPSAPNSPGESLGSGLGSTPFGSLPPAVLLLAALSLGAVVLLRNRTPTLLLDLRFAPPG